MKPPKILNRIVDKVLAYKPKPKKDKDNHGKRNVAAKRKTHSR